MTKEELETKIQELTEAAKGLEEPEKTFKLADINTLKITIRIVCGVKRIFPHNFAEIAAGFIPHTIWLN
jgi:hypothetical protein